MLRVQRLQRFAPVHASVRNSFLTERHLNDRKSCTKTRAAAFAAGRGFLAA